MDEPDDIKNGQNFPVLILQDVFDYLDETQLKTCRTICRYWNACIISYRYLPVVDFHFDLKGLKSLPHLSKSFLPRLLSKQKERRELSTKYVQWLQNFYMESTPRCYELEVNPTLRITNLNLLPNFGNLISSDFSTLLSKTSSLHLLSVNPKVKNVPIDLPSIVKHFHNLKRLKISSNLLSKIGDISSAQNTPPGQNLSCFLNKLTHLEIVIQTDPYNRNDFPPIGILLGTDLKSIKRLSIINRCKTSKVNWDDEATWALNSIDRKLFMASLMRLTHLTLDIDKLPATIFGNLTFHIILLTLELRGLKYLSLKLEGTNLPLDLPSIIQTMTQNGRCSVHLDLKIIYVDMSRHFGNNFVLSLRDLSKCLHKLTLSFSKDFGTNVGTESYCLRQFFPKHEKLVANGTLVTFDNLSCLSIEMEVWTPRIFLDFTSLSSACPNLTELRCIEGSMKGNISKWHLWKRNIRGVSNGMITSWHIRWIMQSFKKLQSLVLWSRMEDVKDETFIWEAKDNTHGSSTYCGCIGDPYHLTHLQKVSLRGVGKLVTDKALKGFYKLNHLKELEIIGNHKISSEGKRNLMQAVTTLHKFTTNL